MRKLFFKPNIWLVCIAVFQSFFLFSQGQIKIEGVVVDQFDYPIPYTSVGIVKKNIGASSTEEGSFSFYVTNNELLDIIEISSIGFEPIEISVTDFIAQKQKRFVLIEKVTALNEVLLESPKAIVKKALKKLKDNTVRNKHKLGVLYRRWSVEDNTCRFFIEQYIDVIDRGPSSYIKGFDVLHSRTSADYRFLKNKQDRHALEFMELNNPMRNGLTINAYSWKKIENTFYENEDIVVIKGTNKKGNYITFYIGYDTFKIYKVEKNSTAIDVGKSLTALYIYKNNRQNKLYLSYHKRQWDGYVKTPDQVKKAMIRANKKVKEYIPVAYRHEAYVLYLEDNSKLLNSKKQYIRKDMSLFRPPYKQQFWDNLSLPPETKFYKKNIGELEGLFGVPVDTQFKYSNSN
ncbi:MAG: hypothetical protein P8L72_01475 [Flavobacteriaceae bacterium]|nr:hypothetical protein [Flavobacteriaceae bacterium]MDG2314040.1 hypothetical protein [Flavobacteriaceae bacterium]